MAHIAHAPAVGFDFIGRTTHFFEAFNAARKLRQTYRATVRELNELSERELNDLGISRYDIPRLAHEHVFGA